MPSAEIVRIGRLEFGAVENNVPSGGRHHAGQNLEQRRLAGAVLAQKTEDFTASHIKRHVLQRCHAGKLFGDAFDGEQYAVG